MLNRLQLFFEKTVNRLENNPASFNRYYYLFAAILVLRLSLEFFSSKRLFTADDILHISLWFIFIVLAFLVQMHLFSGERIQKVARLVIVCFTIALTAPVIDLVATGGRGAKMNYLSLNSWKDIFHSYITIGGASLSRGATLGIRIEIVLLLIASFNYIRTKRKSIFLAIAGVVSLYTVLFFSGTVPFILDHIVRSLHLQYQHDDRSTILLLLTADLLLLFIAFACHSRARLSAVIKKIPWAGFLVMLCVSITGASMAIKAYPGNWALTPTTIFWLPLVIMLYACFAIYTGLQAEGSTGRLQKGILLIMLLITLLVSYRLFFSAALVWALLFMLNEQPLQLRAVPVLRNLLWAMLVLSAGLLGFCMFNAPMIGFPAKWMLAILVSVFAGSMFIELKPGGILYRVKSQAAAKYIAILLLLGAYLFIGSILLNGSAYHYAFLATASIPVYLVWSRPLQTRYILLGTLPAFIFLLWL